VRRLGLLLALAATLLAGSAFPAGTTGANGLKLSAGARPEAMGGAFTGLADDLSALFWNPAGLALLNHPEGSFMHTSYLADTFYDSLAYAQPLGPLGTAAGAVNVLNYGTFRMSSARASNIMDSLSPADVFITGAWGTSAPPFFGLDRLKAGASVKMTFQGLSTGTEGGLALSGGALWETPVEGLRAGMAIDNAGLLVTGGGMLPLSWRLGASYARPLAARFRGVAAVDSLVQVDAGFHGGVGLEVVGYDILALRAGWRGGGAEGGPTAGLGVRYPASLMDRPLLFKLDYALASHGVLGVAHRVQLGLAVTGAAPALAPLKPAPAPAVQAPPPPPPPPLVLSLTRDGMEARLMWGNGLGPMYDAFVVAPGKIEPVRLTESPTSATFLVLSGVLPGEHLFRVVAVDPTRPGWTGGTGEANLVLEPPPAEVGMKAVETVQERSGRINFVKGKADLDPASYTALNEAADLLAQFPQLFVEIAGHTDSKGIPAKNLKLSQDRAAVVMRYLVNRGVAPSRLVARGYGGTVPIADNKTEDGRSANRRVEFKVRVVPPSGSTPSEALKTVQERIGRVTFVKGKADLDPASAPTLDEVVVILAKYPETRVEVAGHTDSKGIPAKNLKLSQDRASAVVKHLVGKGVATSRLEAKGYGGTAPVADNATEEGRDRNRRVEFTVLEGIPVILPVAPAPASTVSTDTLPASSTVSVEPAPISPAVPAESLPNPAPSATVSAEPVPSAPMAAKPVSLPKDPAEALKVVQDRIGRIAFVPGKAELDPASAPTLDAVAKVLARNPKIRIEVAGHTDSVGSAANNLKVSQARAEAVAKYLAKKGVAGSRLVAKGYGGTKPVADNNTDAGRSANRRVEFSIIRSWF